MFPLRGDVPSIVSAAVLFIRIPFLSCVVVVRWAATYSTARVVYPVSLPWPWIFCCPMDPPSLLSAVGARQHRPGPNIWVDAPLRGIRVPPPGLAYRRLSPVHRAVQHCIDGHPLLGSPLPRGLPADGPQSGGVAGLFTLPGPARLVPPPLPSLQGVCRGHPGGAGAPTPGYCCGGGRRRGQTRPQRRVRGGH